MASGMFTYGLDQLLRGNIDLINDAVSVVLCSTNYAPNFATDQNQSDIPEAARLGEAELVGNLINGTTFESNSGEVQNPTSDETANGVALFKNTGDFATSTLIAYYEIAETVTDGSPFVIENDNGWFTI